MIENITVFTHSSIRIKTASQTIYIDPYQMREEPGDADLILITHDHYDHFSPEDIKKVAGDRSVMIVPAKMHAKAQKLSSIVTEIHEVEPGGSYIIDNLSFDAVPAYNKLKPFHPKSAGWVGYNLLIDGKRIYIAGDTDMTEDNRQVKCDIALIPIGGTYTMDARKAAELINTIAPSVAIPTHFGSVTGKKEDADIFASLVHPSIRIENIMQY